MDDGPNWSHQPNAGEESGLAATVATGQYMGSIWKSQYMSKVYGKLYGNILCEGAQGFWLDIDYGNYPYVTSSNTLPYGACSLGFSPKKINKINVF